MAVHLVDHVIPHMQVRQWVLSLPIPLRLLLAAQAKLVKPGLRAMYRVITRLLLSQVGLKPDLVAAAISSPSNALALRLATHQHT